MRPIHALAVALLTAAAIGCSASAPGASPTASPTPSVTASPSASPSASASGSVVELPASIMDPILADAAQRSSVLVEQLVVVSAEAVVWPDGALGCPQPGVSYTQVQVDGYRVVIAAGETTYDYHGSGAGQFRICPTRDYP